MKFTDTWAELLTVLVLVLGGTAGLIRWLWRRHILETSFTMKYRDESKWKTLPVGTHDIPVIVVVSEQLEISQFNVRYVSGTDGGDVNPQEVQVTKLKDEQPVSRSIRHFESRSDRINGVDGLYQPPLVRTPERSLLLTLTVTSHRPRDGYLSFRGQDAGGKFRYSRIGLSFTSERTF